jgi:hypothetical protein
MLNFRISLVNEKAQGGIKNLGFRDACSVQSLGSAEFY